MAQLIDELNMTHVDKSSILIVDDNPINLNILFSYLTEVGFEVLVALSGEEALELTQLTQPDLILLDIMMAGLDGFETCKAFKSQPQTQNVPIIFMTALSETHNKVKGFAAGAVDYITKPIQQAEVLARLQTHLTLKKLQEQLLNQNQQLQQEIQIRQQTEQDLQRYTQELQRRNEDLDMFAKTVAHDLRNPLSTLQGYIRLLLEANQLESLEMLTEIGAAADKMGHIIDALLLLAGVSREKINTTLLDMNDIVSAVFSRLTKMIQRYQGQIQLPHHWPQAYGYAPWIEEVWANYISNGLKYGGQPPELTLGAHQQDDDFICFWIKDKGTGLTPEQQQQLFTSLVQYHGNHHESYGLGLIIIQNIITKLGGQVGVESQLGQGSLFYFTLPNYPLALEN